MDVAVVGGTGAEGFGLTLRLARRRARRDDRIRGMPARAAASAEEATANSPAPRSADSPTPTRFAGAGVTLVTVPFAGAAAIYDGHPRRRTRAGRVVVDCTSPLMTAVGGRA